MITQRDLAAVQADRRRLKQLEEHAVVEQYVLTRKRLDAELAELRRRGGAGEPVEPGKLELIVRRSVVMAWERAWSRLLALPGIAGALRRSPEAQELVRQVAERDAESGLVSERVTVDVVQAG